MLDLLGDCLKIKAAMKSLLLFITLSLLLASCGVDPRWGPPPGKSGDWRDASSLEPSFQRL